MKMEDLFEWVFITAVAIYLFAIQSPNRRQFRRSKVTREQTRLADALLDFVAFFGWQVLPLIAIFSDWVVYADYTLPDWLGWTGTVLIGASLFLFWRAYHDLGRNWSPKIDIKEEQELVTTGAYRYIRHPVYAAMWLWALAQPLLVHNWIGGLALLVTFLPLYLTRVPREEQMMLDNFGAAYREYMARTGRLIPRIK
ncbi:MAG: isoprenylcysteine carboxylmethyltransferase family protein [Anaerolineales bacterium]|nr:isoprenylcysteine carboxylmethyltransferase family protein [Anaerolineales bacterium]